MNHPAPLGGILIVDDDDMQRSVTHMLLRAAGIVLPVEACSGGPQALAYLDLCLLEKRPLPAVVLLDLAMPAIDGIGVLQWIRAAPGLAALRVVILTSSTEQTDRDVCRELGADAYLVKHPTPAVLLSTLAGVGLPQEALTDARRQLA